MKFKDFLLKIKDFLIKRITELFSLIVILLSVTVLISLFSYSPNDPNYIVNNNLKIVNILGFRGSVVSDFLFQSIGLMAYLVPFTIFFTGLKILINKEQLLFIDNLFYCILYIIPGTLFFSYFYDQSFLLTVNGNGGFIGLFLENTFLATFLGISPDVSFYILIIITLFLFFVSINLNLSNIVFIFKSINNFSLKKKKTEINQNDYLGNENETYEKINENKKVQDNLPFQTAEKTNVKKLIIPDLKLLKFPSKNEKTAKKNDDINEEFLEKVLMDFGVEGKIKKINYGPVVTLNEFEPAAGIKVSKIINLSEDSARNTSSDSARISIIPGSNTIGIELPNITRENVYLSEVIKDEQFKKKDIKLPIALGKSISGKLLLAI